MKNVKYLRLVCAVLVYPYIAAFTFGDADSSYSEIDVLFGLGSYNRTTRDCNGNETVTAYPFREYDVNASYGTTEYRVSGTVGTVNCSDKNEWENISGTFIKPRFALDHRYVGFHFGVIHHDNASYFSKNTPVFFLRLGNKDYLHFLIDAGDSNPTYTNGYLKTGINICNPDMPTKIFIGLGAFPSEDIQVIFKANGKLTGNLKYIVNASISNSAEFGIGTGLSYSF